MKLRIEINPISSIIQFKLSSNCYSYLTAIFFVKKII
jgi:hypothetical protein